MHPTHAARAQRERPPRQAGGAYPSEGYRRVIYEASSAARTSPGSA